MMAAAEARAVWQRTANRCFVQEDAKRAPKLACCQSSSSPSKQTDSGATGAADAPDHPALGFMPLNRNPSYSSLPPDTRWWLQLQPSYGQHRGLTYEQLCALESEVESLKGGMLDSPCNESGVHPLNEGIATREFLELTDMEKAHEFLEVEPDEFPASEKTNDLRFDPESPWVGGGKTEPWWRTTDKDELASLVAQRSLDYIGNCDLPPPQKMQVRRHPKACSRCFESESSSLDWKPQTGCTPSGIGNSHSSSDSGRRGQQKELAPIEEGSNQNRSDTSSSSTQKDIMETQVSGTDPTKAELLEALRHSQTRAREAEKAAKQACAEKEHVIKLFFRQASQIFAYKQWFHMLQLEALYFQIKSNEQPLSTIFPVVLPWMPLPCKGRALRKSWQKCPKGKRGKRGRPRPDITKYAVAFALGLSLVGAGLLLGWTVGWMLPF